VIMNVFKSKDIAIGAAHRLLDVGCGDEPQIGPMLELLKGDILNADDLQQFDRNQ
jgi:hypothetical protein